MHFDLTECNEDTLEAFNTTHENFKTSDNGVVFDCQGMLDEGSHYGVFNRHLYLLPDGAQDAAASNNGDGIFQEHTGDLQLEARVRRHGEDGLVSYVLKFNEGVLVDVLKKTVVPVLGSARRSQLEKNGL